MTVEHMFVEKGQNDFSDDDDYIKFHRLEHVLSKFYNIDKKTRL